jgi:hypothetical protein
MLTTQLLLAVVKEWLHKTYFMITNRQKKMKKTEIYFIAVMNQKKGTTKMQHLK